ncbi:hypothetical protein GOP47_0011709 [Adiantum capillus-veneris]|uniref:Uncharacterized protein n=1 Tax=Adiantum capillus-veneris TaxID=13818 RepID=A0A9D4UTS5_ADICA|nr:hypothetical protein GOP47_0011709 [Adiantum capillus-veneris]
MQLYKLKKKDDESLMAHLNKFKALKQQLLGVQKQSPDDEAIAVLLNKVNKAPFDMLMSTLHNMEKKLDEVIATLMEFDSKERDATNGVALTEREGIFQPKRIQKSKERKRPRVEG